MVKGSRWLIFGSTTTLVVGRHSSSDIFFVFDSVTLYADSTGHLGQIKNFAPGQTIKFGNLEYAADARGELAFSGWVSY